MALKKTITSWNEGVLAYKRGRYEDALDQFKQIPESARIFYNMACIRLQMNDEDQALKHLTDAIKKDPILVITYYLRGLILLNTGKPEDAMADFDVCIIWMRGNVVIDYRQLGLLLKLYACEKFGTHFLLYFHFGDYYTQILYHQAAAHIQMGDRKRALQAIKLAEEKQVLTKHISSIAEALHSLQNNQSTALRPMPRPIMCIFVPPKALTQNLDKRDYLGKAEVVSSYEASDTFIGFDGPRKAEERMAKTPSPTSDIGKKMAMLNAQAAAIRGSRSLEISADTKMKAHTWDGPKKIEQALVNNLNIIIGMLPDTKTSSINLEDKPSEDSKQSVSSTSFRRPPPTYPPPPLPQRILTKEGV